MDRIVACHQPNFLPWLGFFKKIALSDTFILLDNVQATLRSKHNWTTRTLIYHEKGAFWLSMPVAKKTMGRQKISELRTDPVRHGWIKKATRTLYQTYSKTPHFNELGPQIILLIENHDEFICKTNITLIRHLVGLLELETTLLLSSDLSVDGASTELLANLVIACNGKTYLSGDGAVGYQDSDIFSDAGVSVSKINFTHPIYAQARQRDFIPGLSIVDALFNIGVAETRALILAN